MYRKTGHFLAIITIAALSLTSCVKYRLFSTPHPDKGTVEAQADFSARSAAAAAPAEYMLQHICCGATDDLWSMPAAEAECVPALFNPGTHSFLAWSSCENVSVAYGTAKVSEVSSGKIHPMPGYLFAARQNAEVAQDDTTRISIMMSQRSRDLRFELTVTEGNPELIAAVEGTLSGIAGTFSLTEQTPSGTPASTVLTFTRDGNLLTADARLLGIIGAEQSLELEIRFTDRDDVSHATVALSEAMSGFNSDMTSARKISGSLNTPVGMDVTAEITGWKDVEGDPAEAE